MERFTQVSLTILFPKGKSKKKEHTCNLLLPKNLFFAKGTFCNVFFKHSLRPRISTFSCKKQNQTTKALLL